MCYPPTPNQQLLHSKPAHLIHLPPLRIFNTNIPTHLSRNDHYSAPSMSMSMSPPLVQYFTFTSPTRCQLSQYQTAVFHANRTHHHNPQTVIRICKCSSPPEYNPFLFVVIHPYHPHPHILPSSFVSPGDIPSTLTLCPSYQPIPHPAP